MTDTGKVILTVAEEAVLRGAPAALRTALRQRLTIANPKYRDAKRYGRWVGKRLKPFLHFYREGKEVIRFPRGFANEAVRLCRREFAIEPEIDDQRRELPPIELRFNGELRPYQQTALAAVLRHDFGVLEAGTGSGKTVVALAAIARRRQPTLVLVHNKELFYQWAERIERFLGLQAGLLGDGHNELAPVTVAIVNSARNRLDDLPRHFGHICVDECHRVPASLFTDVVTAFDCRYALGLSATAFRRDGLTDLIHFYLGDSVHRVDSRQLHRSGAVLRPVFVQRQTDFRYVYRGDYQALMSSLTRDPGRNLQIATDIRNELKNGSGTVLVVSDRVIHCQALAELLDDGTIRVAVLTGRTPNEERAATVERIHNNEIDVLISTVQLIGEGFDCPGLSTLFLTTPIKFTGRLLQVVGRILRPALGKKPKVYDYIDPVGVLKASARARQHLYREQG